MRHQKLNHMRIPAAAGSPDAPTFVLSHALGCDHSMWDQLVPALRQRGPVLCYDQWGHGASPTASGPLSMAQLADDAAALMAELATGPVIWVGLSMGGMIGQELALRHPHLVRALVLANTTSQYPLEARKGWDQRIAAIEAGGLERIVDMAMTRWFHDGFRAAHPEVVAHWRAKVLGCDRASYTALCAAIRDVDTFQRLPQVQVPALVISGKLDLGTPPAMGQAIAQQLPSSTLVEIDQASHLSVLEQPAAFEAAVLAWLVQQR